MDVAANKDRIMPDYLPNYAGRRDVDDALIRELDLAGIEHQKFPESYRDYYGEVKTIILGTMLGWSFKRAWRYWIAEGPGVPLKHAMSLHLKFGQEARVAGHCGAPSPLEYFHGLAVGSYHVDTLTGLKALADTIKAVVQEANVKVDPPEISKSPPNSAVRALPENAIKNYTKKISQVTLTDDVSGHTRREIRTPRFVERNHDGFRVSLTHNHDPLAVCDGCLKVCDIILRYKTLDLYLCTACAEETMRVIQMDIGRHVPA